MAYTDMSLLLSLLMATKAYQLDPQKSIRKKSTGAGFLEAYLLYGDNQQDHLMVTDPARAAVPCRRASPQPSPPNNAHRCDQLWQECCLYGSNQPNWVMLDEWAWKRMP